MYDRYFTEEHEMLRQTVRKFVEKEIAPHVNEWEGQPGLHAGGSISGRITIRDAAFRGIGF